MVGIPRAIDQQCGRFTHIKDGNVYVAVIIDIAKGSAPATRQRNLRQPRACGDVLKRTVAQVAEQLHRLAVLQTTGNRVHLRVHMSICNEDIQPAGITEVNKAGSPFYVRITGLASLRSPADVSEALSAEVAVQIVGLLGEISNVDTQTPVVTIVSEVYAHRAEFLPVNAEGNPIQKADFFEGPIVLVAVKKIGTCVVGHVQIGPAVVIVIAPHGPESVPVPGIVNASFLGDLLKRTIAAVVIKQVAFALHAPRAALHQDSFVATEFFITSEFRQLVDIQMDISCHKEVDVAVAIVVGPRGPGHEATPPHSGLLGHVFELAISQPAVKRAASKACNKHV